VGAGNGRDAQLSMLKELEPLADQLRMIRQELLDTLDRLTPEQMRVPFPGRPWAIQDDLAHLTANESLMTDVLASIATSGPSPLPDDFDNGRFNAETVARAKDESILQLRDDLEASRRKLFNVLAALTPEQLEQRGSHPLQGLLTVKEFLVVMYAHEVEHVREIVEQARRLKRQAVNNG
jgi:uncharacterized damage-inducible protein DinB